jgi:TetR/AcrR family transcriptional regulator
MTDHRPTQERREQIVQVALELLADQSVELLSTRAIALRMGLSQPAIFRHFRTRDELLEGVVAHAREGLADLAARELAGRSGGLRDLSALVRALFCHVQRHPGLPRILFHDASGAGHPQLRAMLHALVDMQRTLVAELVRAGQREGEIPDTVAPEHAGQLFVALLQGTLLQWRLAGAPQDPGPDGLTMRAEVLIAFLQGVLRAGEPTSTGHPSMPDCHAPVPSVQPPTHAGHAGLVQLDVRPILATGTDPLHAILAALQTVAPDGMLQVIAPFRPAPLLALLTGQGFRCEAILLGSALWQVEVLGPDAPEVADLRELEAPEPLEQVLLRSSRLLPGQSLLARVPRMPALVLPLLAERGLHATPCPQPDGSALLHVRRPA